MKIVYGTLLVIGTVLSCGLGPAEDNPKLLSDRPDTSKYNKYSWVGEWDRKNALVNRIGVPTGAKRVSVLKNSFGDWLRHVPLKPGEPAVKLYNGEDKWGQDVHYAVLDIDVGKEDLQQCADAVMRLKAEYHYARKEYSKIHFKFTSGHNALFTQWIEGFRPVIQGSKVTWIKKAQRDDSYKSFKAYLREVFMYAGSSSLSKELLSVPVEQMRVGDVFIKGGFPGHAVIVMDMAKDSIKGKTFFIVAQSYMPAQEPHVLKNPSSEDLNPWYSTDFGPELVTPEWVFQRGQLMRFKD